MQSIEYTQLVIKQGVCIFKIPPVSQSKGFYLDDWKEMIWEGGVKVVDKDNKQTVQFVSKDGSIFAVCQVSQNYQDSVQKTLDSSRGVAVRLQNPNGGFMWVGVAFRDRNDAFDFNVAVQEYQTKKQREIDPTILEKEFQPKQDFSLGEGQKLVITSQGAQLTSNQNKSNSFGGNTNLSQFE